MAAISAVTWLFLDLPLQGDEKVSAVRSLRHFLVFRDRRRYKRAIPAASPAPLEADAEFPLHYKA